MTEAGETTVLRDQDAVTLVVPLFNEHERLQEYGDSLAEFVADQPRGSELLFVDDGSVDGTQDLVQDLIDRYPAVDVRLLARRHEGKGAAVASGIRTARAPIVAFCDIDLSTPLEQLDRLIEITRRTDVLAVASRDMATSVLVRPEGRIRENLGRLLNRVLQATLTPGIVDTQCGAKSAKRQIWEAILPASREAGYVWDAEAIALARAVGVRVQEVPVAWRHDPRSKVRLLRDGAAMVAAIPRIRRTVRRAACQRRSVEHREVFDEANAALLSESDTDHWWFRSKAAYVATALRRSRSLWSSHGWLLDVGAGSGGVTSMLGWDPTSLVVVEGNETLLNQARTQHGLLGVRASAGWLPFDEGMVDALCLLDVLEHLAQPTAALVEARRVLRRDGRLIISVPAHRWLWSKADEFLGHVCRYTRPALRRQLMDAGFEPELLTHIFSWLVAPAWLTRRALRRDTAELGLDRTSAPIDAAAMVLTLGERLLIGRVPIPFGTSILCVARKAVLPDGTDVTPSYQRSA